MTLHGWIQIAIFAALVVTVVVPLGGYMAQVFAGERTPLIPILMPIEGIFYRLAGVNARHEQSWISYTVGALLFNLVGFPSSSARQSGMAHCFGQLSTAKVTRPNVISDSLSTQTSSSVTNDQEFVRYRRSR